MDTAKINIHNRDITLRLKAVDHWKISEDDKRGILDFLKELAIGKVNKGKRISEARQSKYLDLLKPPLEFLKKPSTKFEIKDIELFEKNLIKNSIKRKNGEPYSDSTKSGMRRALQIYLKWKLGIGKGLELTNWLDFKSPKKTPNYLTEKEIEKLYKACDNAENRFLISVLFDSGARAEEFHNIRYEDIQLPSQNDAFVKITLKEEYSKTLGRTISLYWEHSLEAVRDYMEQRRQEEIKFNEPIFNKKYDPARKFLNRLGKKILNKNIHYHLFRHSSATFYASELNRQQLCIRYGWRFSSDMPDVYISRIGMDSIKVDEKFKGTEIEELRKKLEKRELEHSIKQENLEKKYKELGEQMKEIQKLTLQLKEVRKVK